MLKKEIQEYNQQYSKTENEICNLLANHIQTNLNFTDSKIWHAHPVWFIEGNPIVGYSKLKGCIRLLFWSGQSFDEDELQDTGKFKAAEIRYTESSQINFDHLSRWLDKAEKIQWDYKNIMKRKGKLLRLK